MSRNIAKESLGTVLNILRVLWIYPTESVKIPPKVWKFCTWTVHLFFVVVPLSLTVIYTITEKITDVQSISDTIFITSEIFADIIKYIPLRLYPNRYKELVETLNSPMFNSYLKEQKYYMDETVKFIRKISFFIMVQIGISLGTAILNPLFVDAPKFVIPLWIPSAIEENKLAYLLFAGYIYCFLFYTAIGHSAIDILIPAMYSHAATQLRILKDTLEHLGRRTKEKCAKRVDLSSEERRELEKKILYSEICYCVEHYEAIAQFVKALESGFMGIVLPQVVVSVLTICLTAFHLSFVTPGSFKFFQVCSYALTILMEIYLFAYYGTILVEESNSITNAIYMGNWYEFDLKSKKALIILMERTKRPLKCTAALVIDITLETFTKTVKASFSLLAVLRSFSTENNP